MQFRKLAAVAGSALMAGLALAGPVIATQVTQLGKISDMVSVSGTTASFPIFVIGATAQTADVAGAVDIATNLASNAVVTSSVTSTVPGESVTGGAKIATSGIYLTPYTNPQNVKGIMTASDIPSLLTGGTYATSSGGSYQYKQYLYILGQSSNTNPAQITFTRPTTESTPRVTFKTPGSSTLWTYKVTFSTPVSLSGVISTTLLQTAIQGTTINLLGKDFIVSDCTAGGTGATGGEYISDITLLGGNNVVTVETGTPKTVTASSKDYTVTLTGVAAQTVGSSTYYSAIGDINGESFTLKAGETKTMSDGTMIAAIKVFQGKTGAADYATIAIGADKIKLTRGTGAGTDAGASGTVTKGTTVVSELSTDIVSTDTAGWSTLIIKYTPSSDAWLSAGGQVTDQFASTFNLKFNSIIPDLTDTANRQTITFTPSGYSMLLTYKNAADAEKQMWTLYTTDGTTWKWAQAPAGSPTNYDNNYRDVVFDEGANISAVEQDYFVIQKGGFSHTMQFTAYTNSTKTYTFTDESGNSLTAVGSTGVANDTADLIVDGNTYKIWLYEDTKKIVHIDLNGDSYIAGNSTGTATTLNGGLYGVDATGREYSYLVPKLITPGQGGLYFYNGTSAAMTMTASTWKYPKLGFAGIRLARDGATTITVGEFDDSTGAWTNQSSTMTIDVNSASHLLGNYSVAKTPGYYIDYQIDCINTSALWAANTACTVGLGKSGGALLGGPGFILVEQAQQGGTTHNWIYLPVYYDSATSRVSVNTTAYSDDSNYVDNSVLGTNIQYKGMTTYGSLVDHLSSSLGGSATINFPGVFTFGNVYIMTPTGTVTSGGTGGTMTTQQVLPITADVVKLDTDSDISTAIQNNDVIIVGGPCINKIAAQVLGKTYPACGAASGIPENAALIQLFTDKFATGKTALLVAGWEADNTDLAARIVQTGFPGATATQKAATTLTVTGTVVSPSYS
jgi:hypothetical protein